MSYQAYLIIFFPLLPFLIQRCSLQLAEPEARLSLLALPSETCGVEM